MSVILVTGSSTGIGQETALHMARKGHVVYAARAQSRHRRRIERQDRGGESARYRDPAGPGGTGFHRAAVARIMQEQGRLDALVANAGIGAGSSVEETPLSVAREIFETNYFGNVTLLREVTPILRKQRAGRVVVVGSLAGRYVAGCHGHYSASKWAMEGLCEALAQEMAEFGCQVSIIEPGCVATPMWTKGDTAFGAATVPEDRRTIDALLRGWPAHAGHARRRRGRHRGSPHCAPAALPLPGRQGRQRGHRSARSRRRRAWINMLTTDDDAAFADGWKEIVGVDYYRD